MIVLTHFKLWYWIVRCLFLLCCYFKYKKVIVCFSPSESLHCTALFFTNNAIHQRITSNILFLKIHIEIGNVRYLLIKWLDQLNDTTKAPLCTNLQIISDFDQMVTKKHRVPNIVCKLRSS